MKSRQNNQWWITHERLLRVTLGDPEYVITIFCNGGFHHLTGGELRLPSVGYIGNPGCRLHRGVENINTTNIKKTSVCSRQVPTVLYLQCTVKASPAAKKCR